MFDRESFFFLAGESLSRDDDTLDRLINLSKKLDKMLIIMLSLMKGRCDIDENKGFFCFIKKFASVFIKALHIAYFPL